MIAIGVHVDPSKMGGERLGRTPPEAELDCLRPKAVEHRNQPQRQQQRHQALDELQVSAGRATRVGTLQLLGGVEGNIWSNI